MRASVLREHGDNSKFKIETDFPDPTCPEDGVVVAVKATSLNYHDIFTRRGMPGITLDFPIIAGLDVAGEIAEVGAHVQGWSVGDAVLIDPRNRVEHKLVGETMAGGLADYCACPAHQLVSIPEGVSYAQAASLPVAYGTAHTDDDHAWASLCRRHCAYIRRERWCWHWRSAARKDGGCGDSCLFIKPGEA